MEHSLALTQVRFYCCCCCIAFNAFSFTRSSACKQQLLIKINFKSQFDYIFKEKKFSNCAQVNPKAERFSRLAANDAKEKQLWPKDEPRNRQVRSSTANFISKLFFFSIDFRFVFYKRHLKSSYSQLNQGHALISRVRFENTTKKEKENEF